MSRYDPPDLGSDADYCDGLEPAEDEAMNENRDWPASLRLSAARDQLAQAIYFARAEAYSIGSPHWEGLSPAVRDSYRKVALEVLEKLKPEPRTAASYFDVAADAARTAASDIMRSTWGKSVRLVRAIADDIIDPRD